MDFAQTPDQLALRGQVIDFARAQLRDDVVSRDHNGSFAHELWARCAAFGIQGLPFPAQYGGGGRDILSTVVAMEALGYACADNGLVFALGAQLWSVQMPIARFGSDEQKGRYLSRLCRGENIGAHAMSERDAGSDAYSIRTSAQRVDGGYRLDGAKTFVSQAAVADVFLVFARVGEGDGPLGITAFLVERGTPGFTVGQTIEKMGLRTSPMASLTFDNCVLPEFNRLGREERGAQIFRDSIEWERSCILAGAVGAMERLLEGSLRYAREREQFGRPIASFASVTNRLVDMKVGLEQARLALYRAAWAKEHDVDAATASSMAKLFVSEAYQRAALNAMEIRAGYGYAVEHEIERDVRDALGSTFYSGTSDIQRVVIARGMGLRAS